ncbi:MAG: hypothetical protein ACRC14_08110 [Paracoccaceae bacterium]
MTDFSRKTNQQIDQWIENHERKNARTAPLYAELLLERARRGEDRSTLKLDRSLATLRDAAMALGCVTYGDLAKASGSEWQKVRHRMNGPGGHLDQLLDVCHAQGLPMLAALCVNEEGRETGELGPAALAGFAAGARRLGYTMIDERAFHHSRRDECWEWGKAARA